MIFLSTRRIQICRSIPASPEPSSPTFLSLPSIRFTTTNSIVSISEKQISHVYSKQSAAKVVAIVFKNCLKSRNIVVAKPLGFNLAKTSANNCLWLDNSPKAEKVFFNFDISFRFTMGGHDHHHEPYKVPSYKIYKIEAPELVEVQQSLARQGLKDPWLRWVHTFALILFIGWRLCCSLLETKPGATASTWEPTPLAPSSSCVDFRWALLLSSSPSASRRLWELIGMIHEAFTMVTGMDTLREDTIRSREL